MNEEIYDKARAILSQRRNSAISENDRRIQEINDNIPEIREINEALFNTGKELIRAVTSHEEGDIKAKIERIKRDNLSAQDMCRKLLVSHGYPADYLDIHFTCPVCSDTGSNGTQICDCLRQVYGKLMAESFNSNAQLELSSFDTFSLSYYSGDDYYTMKRILEYCKRYAGTFSMNSGNILMFGKTGLGKTHLSLAIASEVMKKGYSVVVN